jgi:hypothetical protein
MLAKVTSQLGAVKRNLWPDGINDDEPILVVLNVETAKGLAPRKLLLAVKV